MPNPTSLNFIQLSYNRLKLFYYYFDLEDVVVVTNVTKVVCTSLNCCELIVVRIILNCLKVGLFNYVTFSVEQSYLALCSGATGNVPYLNSCLTSCRERYALLCLALFNLSLTTKVNSLRTGIVIRPSFRASINFCVSAQM